ncbi:mas-related G-protein coupled receptor member H-like [Cyanocitta cristata]
MELSPTEGPGPCAINLAVRSVTLLICLCGLAGNVAVFCLLGPSIHSKAITVYIFHLAITDFACLLFIITSALILLVEDVFCSIIVPRQLLILLSLPLLFSYILGLYLMTAISFSRCRSILCPLCCRCHRPQHQSKVVSAMLWAISTTVIPTLTSLFISDNAQRFIVTLTLLVILNFLFFASSVVISSIYLFITVVHACHQRPPERLDIIVFLMVLFSLPAGICSFLLLFHYSVYPPALPLFVSIHTSIKPFIYFLVGRCRRHGSVGSLKLSLQRVLGEPEETTARSNDAAMGMAV